LVQSNVVAVGVQMPARQLSADLTVRYDAARNVLVLACKFYYLDPNTGLTVAVGGLSTWFNYTKPDGTNYSSPTIVTDYNGWAYHTIPVDQYGEWTATGNASTQVVGGVQYLGCEQRQATLPSEVQAVLAVVGVFQW